MAQVRFRTTPVAADRLTAFAARLLTRYQVSPADAATVADSLVQANLRGVDSHGVARLPHYLRRLRHGSVNPQPRMTLERLASASASRRRPRTRPVGHDAGYRRSDFDCPRKWLAGSRSGTPAIAARLAYYGLRMADAGMLGLVFTHVDPMVLPFGARGLLRHESDLHCELPVPRRALTN